MQGSSYFAVLGGTRAPFWVLHTVLDDPRVALNLVQGNALLGVENKEL